MTMQTTNTIERLDDTTVIERMGDYGQCRITSVSMDVTDRAEYDYPEDIEPGERYRVTASWEVETHGTGGAVLNCNVEMDPEPTALLGDPPSDETLAAWAREAMDDLMERLTYEATCWGDDE